MPNLTPQLNETQLRANIDALQKGGMANDKVQEYVNNYSKGTNGNYVLKGQPSTTQPQNGGNLLGNIGNALISSERGLGNDIGSALTANSQVDQASRAAQDAQTFLQTVVDQRNKAQAQGQDTSHWDTILKNYQAKGFQMPDLPTTGKVLGDAAGVALDIASAGSYGTAARGAEIGSLLAKGGGTVENIATKVGIPVTRKVVAPVVENAIKPTLTQTLKNIGTKTLARVGVGAGTGYGYDVANNLQQGKTGSEVLAPGYGTLLGGTVPALIGGVQAGVTITKDTAPRFINSLIKPKQADFSYGKDPGRTVSELGITGNSLPDFANNLHTAKNEIGSKLGAIYSAPENAGLKINANDEIAKIDEAIANAAKGGKENQGIVTTLQNTKDALLYEHHVNAEGVITKKLPDASSAVTYIDKNGQKIFTRVSPEELNVLKNEVENIPNAKGGSQIHLDPLNSKLTGVAKEVGRSEFLSGHPQAKSVFDRIPKNLVSEATPRDLSNLSPEEAFNLKKLVAEQTKFTGKPSDDKTVNAVLKDIYGGLKEKLNTALGTNNPEITDLNQKYADLTSAELATRNRDAIVRRADIISMPIKVGGAAAIVSALATGGAAIPAILAGAGVAGLDKALESTAVRTRIAAWLGSQSPSTISSIIQKNPEIKTTLYRLLPKLSSQIGN